MRIALIHVSQETNDFNPVLTTLRDYKAFGIFEGSDILEKLREHGQIGGHLQAVQESGLEIETIPIIRGLAVAGGRITREAFDFFADRIKAGLEAAGPIDGLALQLHGACAAEGIDDVEGAQVELCRSILGDRIPIVLGLDHHANVTQKIIDNSTAIVGHRTQPHDPFDTGKIGTELLLKILTQGAKPVMAWRKIPLLSHQEQFLTSGGPMKAWFDPHQAWKRTRASCRPLTIPCSRGSTSPKEAGRRSWSPTTIGPCRKLADELSDLVWSLRDDFQVKDAVPIDEAVRMADEQRKESSCSATPATRYSAALRRQQPDPQSILRLGIKKFAP